MNHAIDLMARGAIFVGPKPGAEYTGVAAQHSIFLITNEGFAAVCGFFELMMSRRQRLRRFMLAPVVRNCHDFERTADAVLTARRQWGEVS